MTIFISRGCYTVDAVRGMISAPENREEAVAKLLKEFGGRLISYYMTLGEFVGYLLPNFLMRNLYLQPFLQLWRAAASRTFRQRLH
jgi:GYD domain